MIKTPFGDATEVSTQVFLQKVLPPLCANINLDTLFEGKTITSKSKLVTKNGRLWGYDRKGPSAFEGKLAAFRSLRICASKLATAAPGGCSVSLHYENNDTSEWSLERRAVDALPDAYFLLKSARRDLVDWTTIAVSGVYSKTCTTKLAKENIVKITRCLAHSMHCDARRRFAYGFSIEDSKTRLWYCDRSRIIASEVFDFVIDWRTLFHFFLSTMLAKHHELGLDPSVVLIYDNANGHRYEITVPSTAEQAVYRTVSVLSDTTPGAIIGRGTRVWKAIRVENDVEIGEPVALKDSWVDNDGEREGTTYTNILASTTGIKATELLKKYLLTVDFDGDVFVNGVLDCTPKILPQSAGNDFHTDHEHQRHSHPPSCLVHYRVVYEEVCEASLHYVASLHTVFKALGDACVGLGALHECGWVHRDISPANILLYGDSIKIADLEYASRYEDLQHKKHEVVGTEKYIATEVQLGRYLFYPIKEPRISSAPPGFNVNAFVRENEARKKRGEPQIPFPKSPSPTPVDTEPVPHHEFSYIPLHDLESLWWIGLSFLIYRRVDEKSKTSTFTWSDVLQRLVTNLFWSCSGDSRSLAIGAYGYLKGHLWDFHPSVRDAAEQLMGASTTLVADYRDTFSTPFRNNKHETYPVFLRRFYTVARMFQTQDVMVHAL